MLLQDVLQYVGRILKSYWNCHNSLHGYLFQIGERKNRHRLKLRRHYFKCSSTHHRLWSLPVSIFSDVLGSMYWEFLESMVARNPVIQSISHVGSPTTSEWVRRVIEKRSPPPPPPPLRRAMRSRPWLVDSFPREGGAFSVDVTAAPPFADGRQILTCSQGKTISICTYFIA